MLLFASCRAETTHPGKSIGVEKYPEAQDLYQFAENSAQNTTGRRWGLESSTGEKSSGWEWPVNESADREIGRRWTTLSRGRLAQNP
jgi:hypothetical protein